MSSKDCSHDNQAENTGDVEELDNQHGFEGIAATILWVAVFNTLVIVAFLAASRVTWADVQQVFVGVMAA